MVEKGIYPETVIVRALLDACCKNRRIDIAQQVFEKTFGGPSPLLTPDEQVFRALLECHLKSDPPHWKAACWILQVAEKQFNCTLSCICYNCLLEACSRTSDFERGEDILEKMATAGIKPDENILEFVKSR